MHDTSWKPHTPECQTSLFLYEGTREYAPPEWVSARTYAAGPMTVWQLGTLLYSMLHGDVPFANDTEILRGQPCWYRRISEDCQDFIQQCLRLKAEERPSLAQLATHKWLANVAGT